jgi:hypothetical protein
MKNRVSLFLAPAAAFFFMVCGDLQNPWTDPSSSVISGDRSLTGLPSTINEYQVYPCSLHVILPELSDSLVVMIGSSAGDLGLWHLSPLTAADTTIALSIAFPAGAQSPLRVYLYRKNGTIDSLVKVLEVLHPTSITMTGLPSALNENQEYPCSLYVLMPALSDSLIAVMHVSGSDRVLWRLSPLSVSDTALGLSIGFPAGIQSPLRVYLHRKNGMIDSLVKPVVVRHMPSISPDAPNYSTFMNDVVHPVFSITDPDGDIRSCQIWIDSTTGLAVVPPLTRTSTTTATVTWAVSSPSFDSVIVFAQALDSAGNASAMAQCTVFVADTVKPRLSLVRLSPSINDSTVNKLPCSLLVKITDDSRIDSAGYAINPFIVRPMTLVSDSIALAIIADLDSGGNFYEAQAWDNAGNLGVLRVPIYYTGTVMYRFTFSNIVNRTVNENGSFPPINLDSSISISPPPVGVPNWKANVQWQVLEQNPTTGIKATLNTATRVVSFAVPDSEWNGAESFTFIANWPDMATGNAGAIYTVNPVNDPPVITLKAINRLTKRNFDTIWADTCVRDPDHKPSTISWTQDTTRGKIYTLNWISRLGLSVGPEPALPPIIDGGIFIDLWTRKWTIVVKNPKSMFMAGSTYYDTLRLIARDGAGAVDSQEVAIKATY